MEKVIISKTIPSTEEVLETFKNPQAGAVVIFEGKPRDDNGIIALKYEIYDDMALKELNKIREDTLRKFPILEAYIFHRKGLVKVGETSFKVIVFSKHRKEAFEACSHIVDEVKKRVPIWKKEIFENREGEWILGI
jgi:molybdopterin synthase catalytic subunit